MKTSRSELRSIALDLLREHKGIKVRKTLRESRRMQSQRHMLLRKAMKQHMIQEGFFDSVKSMFGKAADAAGSFIDKFKSAKSSYTKAYNSFNNAFEDAAIPYGGYDPSGYEALGNVFALTNAVAAASMSNHDKYNKFFVRPQAKALNAWIKQLQSDEPWKGNADLYDALGITRALQAANSVKKRDEKLNKLVSILRNVQKTIEAFGSKWLSLMREAKQKKAKDMKSWQRLRAGNEKIWEKIYKDIDNAVKPAVELMNK